jgi:tetraacyldisaccharide 4'-kinase
MLLIRRLISALLHLVISIRHWCYGVGIFQSKSAPVKTIVIGNLAIGGSGKTPFTDALIHQLKKDHSIAFLSRGYGRSTKGIKQIQKLSTAEEVGDEPKLIALHHPEIPSYVGEKRWEAAIEIHQNHPEVQSIVLDDAFQHRALKGDINILLSRYAHPFYNDHLWPWGGLRDLKSRAEAADLIAFTGSPSILNREEKEIIRAQVAKFSAAPVFFFHTVSLPLRPVFNHEPNAFQNWGSFSGIAHPESFHQSLKAIKPILDSLNFADHHAFDSNDLEKIKSKMVNFGGRVEAWVTTEKDAMRIKDLNDWKGIPIFYLPIVIKINEEEETEWNLWWKKKI